VTQESVARLAEIVCGAAIDWPAAELCCAALRSTTGSLVGERARKEHLVRTYTVRLTNPDRTTDVIGLERLLADFDAYPRQELVGFVHASKARRIYTMFFDDGVTRLVACFVGMDRTADDESEATTFYGEPAP